MLYTAFKKMADFNMQQGQPNQGMPPAPQQPAAQPQQPPRDPNKQPPITVAADAFRNQESFENFMTNMPQTVRNHTKGIFAQHPMDAIKSIFSKNIDPQTKSDWFNSFKQQNPEWFPSMVNAIKNGSPDVLKQLQEMGQSGTQMFNQQEMGQIMSAAKTATWNAVKQNPVQNIPKAVGLFLRSKGMNGMAGITENPFMFYGGLLAAVAGGAYLLSGGDDDDEADYQR